MEPTNLPAKRLNETSGEDKPQIFRTLRNIDLNLLTIFEAVYVHKGIVNAAKILNLTPSAISQSIQKLRAIFPDPLFIRKGRGVTPPRTPPICEYISQGLESILGALDLTGSYDKQRTITIGTSPSVGVLVMPAIYQAVKQHAPQLLIRNVPVNDPETQLAQFQTDLIIDSNSFAARALGHNVLYTDSLALVCRQSHPALGAALTPENLRHYEHATFMSEGQGPDPLRQRIDELFPDRLISFSSYNMFTLAALIGSSDLLCIMPVRLFTLLQKCWPLESIPLSQLTTESVEISLHYNKLSLRDPVLENVINVIRQAF